MLWCVSRFRHSCGVNSEGFDQAARRALCKLENSGSYRFLGIRPSASEHYSDAYEVEVQTTAKVEFKDLWSACVDALESMLDARCGV